MAGRYLPSVWMSAVIVQALVLTVQAGKLPNIYWNMSNPIFRIDNTDHIIDVNREVIYDPRKTDQVDIVCPKHDETTSPEDVERYVVYNVTKEEYESCTIHNIRSKKIIAQCNKPYSNLCFTITFRSFTPQPGAMEYKPGHDYFFIAVSENYPAGENYCSTKNMRVQFKVCCKDERATETPPVHHTRRPGKTTTTTPQPSTTTTSTTPVPDPSENDIRSGNEIYPFYRVPASSMRPVHDRLPPTIAYWPHMPSNKPSQRTSTARAPTTFSKSMFRTPVHDSTMFRDRAGTEPRRNSLVNSSRRTNSTDWMSLVVVMMISKLISRLW